MDHTSSALENDGRLVSTTTRTVLSASALMVVATLGSRVLGMVRESVTSGIFGRAGVGALEAAFRFPDFLYFLLAGGALRSGFMPIFTRYMNGGEESRAWRTFSLLCTTVFVVACALVAGGILLASPLTGLISQGFASETLRADAVRAAQWLFAAQIAFLLSGVFSGVLNAMGSFLLPALGPSLYNLSIILGALLLGSSLGIQGAALGGLAGAWVGHFLLQAVGLWRKRARFRPALALRDPDFVEVIKLALPIVLGLCVAEVNLVISSLLAGRWFGEEDLGAFRLALRLARLPDGLFGGGLGIALFPVLSTLAARGQFTEFRQRLEMILRVALLCALPSAVVLAVLRQPLIGALYGYGKMGGGDVAAVAELLPIFALVVVPITWQAVISRAFYAQEDTVTPVKVGAAAVAVGIALNFGLGWLLQIRGIVLALALTSLLNIAGLVYLYHRRLGFGEARRLLHTALHSLLASAVLAGVAGGVEWLLRQWLGPVQGWQNFLPLLLGLGAGGLAYVVVLQALRVREIDLIVDLARQQLGRGKGRGE